MSAKLPQGRQRPAAEDQREARDREEGEGRACEQSQEKNSNLHLAGRALERIQDTLQGRIHRLAATPKEEQEEEEEHIVEHLPSLARNQARRGGWNQLGLGEKGLGLDLKCQSP